MLPLVKELIHLSPALSKSLRRCEAVWALQHWDEIYFGCMSRPKDSSAFKTCLDLDRSNRLKLGFSSIHELGREQTLALDAPSHVINVLKRYKELLVHCTAKAPIEIPANDLTHDVGYQYEKIIPGVMIKHKSAGSAYSLGTLVHVCAASTVRNTEDTVDRRTYDCTGIQEVTFEEVGRHGSPYLQREYYVYARDLIFIGDEPNPQIQERLAELLANPLFLEAEHEIVMGMIEFEVSTCALPYFYIRTMLSGTLLANSARGPTHATRMKRLIHQTKNEVLMDEGDRRCYPVNPGEVVDSNSMNRIPPYLVR